MSAAYRPGQTTLLYIDVWPGPQPSHKSSWAVPQAAVNKSDVRDEALELLAASQAAEQSDAPGTPDNKSDAQDGHHSAEESRSGAQGIQDNISDVQDGHQMAAMADRSDVPALAAVIRLDALGIPDNRSEASQLAVHPLEVPVAVQSDVPDGQANKSDVQAHNRSLEAANK